MRIHPSFSAGWEAGLVEEDLGGCQEGDGGRQEARESGRWRCPLKRSSGMSMASSTAIRGRDRRTVENGYGESG